MSDVGLRPLRGAVVGCGMIAEFHLRAWQRIKEVEIVALCDLAFGRAERRRDQFAPAARVYLQLTELLAHETLDFIDVITPPAMHRQHCLEALDAGLNVICQKPLAVNLIDAQAMVDAFAASHKTLAIHENHRFRPWFQEILRRNRDGFFGTIRFARFEQFDCHQPREEYKLQAGQGILLEYGTHLLDMIHALLGPCPRVMATGHRLNPHVVGESLVHLTLKYPDTTACVDIAWKPSGLRQGSVLIVGEKGEAIYEGTMTRGEQARFRLVDRGEVVLDETRSPYNDYEDSFFRFQQEVADAWIGQQPVPQPAHANLRVLQATVAAYRAIESGEITDSNPET